MGRSSIQFVYKNQMTYPLSFKKDFRIISLNTNISHIFEKFLYSVYRNNKNTQIETHGENITEGFQKTC